MPKLPEEVTIKVRSQVEGVVTSRVGLLVEGTSKCLATIEYDQGYVIYHVISGCTIGSNLDNTFKSRGKAEEFAVKFWGPIHNSDLAYSRYRTSDDVEMLRVVTPPVSAHMAKMRTRKSTMFYKKKKGIK